APDILLDLDQTEELMGKRMGDEPTDSPEFEAAVPVDLSHLVMTGIFRRRDGLGELPQGGVIVRRGRLLIESLMRPLLVELFPEGIEASLLGCEGRLGRSRALRLKRSVHPFVTAILVGPRGLNALMLDAQLHPPDAKLAEAAEAMTHERSAVVGGDRPRQSIATKGLRQRPLGSDQRGRRLRFTQQQKSARRVADGERIAIDSLQEPELTLIIGAPDVIRFGRFQRAGSRMACRAASATRLHKLLAVEQVTHRTGRRKRWGKLRMLACHPGQNLSRSPGRVCLTYLHQQLGHPDVHPLRAPLRGSGAIREAVEAIHPIALEPFVPILTADPVPGTQLRHPVQTGFVIQYESVSLLHRQTHFPRHGPP